jgi:hypothetical protein
LTLAWEALGSDFAFEPGSSRVTPGWLAVALPLSFAGAVIGGLIAAGLSRPPGGKPVAVLAVIVLVLGLFTAFSQLAKPAPPEPGVEQEILEGEVGTSDWSAMQAASRARQPIWYTFLLPWVGAAGLLVGGRLYRKLRKA